MICEKCINKEVCKHRETVERTEEYIKTIPNTAPLDVTIKCTLRRYTNA